MPKGIELFREKFAAHTDKYVLIGGTACELAMQEADLEFRATKDLDIVLTVETLGPVFSALFWEFVKAGGYEHQQAGPEGKPQCYRFVKPKDENYPFMLELFSRRSDLMQAPADRLITRIHADDDASSLSAILMDDAYYGLVQAGRRMIDGLSCLNPETIIPLKAKAFLDLSERKSRCEKIDSQHIKKHKLDVFRLSALLADTTRVRLPDSIRRDFQAFVDAMASEEVDARALGIRNRTKDQILVSLSASYEA
jgi:hypothetical protein